jgi:hypothetical protein
MYALKQIKSIEFEQAIVHILCIAMKSVYEIKY